MKVRYDPQTDSLTIILRDERIKESDEIRPGVIVQNTREMQFAIAD